MNRQESQIFESAAQYYARYRHPYPAPIIERIADTFELDGSGRMLDLGCGTGQLAIPLAPRFDEVIALDPVSEMLVVGREKALSNGVGNIRWMQGGSDDLSSMKPVLGQFRLVTIGNAFHWMDRDATLAALNEFIQPSGGIAILGGSSAGGVWEAEGGWKGVARSVIQRWAGEQRLAGTNSTYVDPPERHEVMLARSSFNVFEISYIPFEFTLDLEGVIGLLYSTSYASPSVLGEKRQGFEDDLRASLLELDSSGRFADVIDYELMIARRS